MSSADTKPKAVPFRDLGKFNEVTTKQFLSKGHFSVVAETKADAVSFKATASNEEDRDTKVKGVSAIVEPKFEWKEHNLVFEGKLSTANSLTEKVTAKDLFVRGLNVYLQGDRQVSFQDKEVATKLSGTAGFQFNNEFVHWTSEVKVPEKDNVSVTGSFHAKPHENVSIGLSADHKFGEKSKTTVEGRLIGTTDQLEGGLSLNFPDKVVGLGFWHKYCSKFQWSLTSSLPVATPAVPEVAEAGAVKVGEAKTGGVQPAPSAKEDVKPPVKPALNLAGVYKFDDYSTVRGRLTANIDRTASLHEYRLALGTQQKVSENVTLNLGADINLNHALCFKAEHSTVGKPTSYGFSVSLK